ncbi:hypothetical protein [Streptomyces dysideae]|uniref:Uncharacterized protein n=1 Tax=Streptomyces dysideae TaxID=909626 RepID=A0A117RZ25_9ACTN|nr:hypothetical protein [Streptomyces dysideae]KUO16624.1 hypothetical protein AQJ91_34370 [Streptomyces dysideae]
MFASIGHKRIATLAGSFLALVATSVLVASPAGAGEYDVFDATNSHSASLVTFTSYGEHLYVLDGARDDHGVAGQWRYYSGATIHSYYNGRGYGYQDDNNLDLPENLSIQIRACLQDGSGGKPWGCGSWVNAHT